MNTIETLGRKAPATLRQLACSFVALVMAAGCATTESKPPPARADIDTAVGFTITEEARIDGAVRADYEQALVMLEQGDHATGVVLLESIAEEAPHLSAPLIDLGIAHHRAGDMEAAEASLKKALAAHPGHPIAHNELGIVYRKTGRFAEARRQYEAALNFYSGYHFARRNLAVLCDLYLGDLDCALANYEAYMATVPEDEEASMWIRDVRLRMEQAGVGR